MKRYYTSDKENPDHEDYNPRTQVPRPLYSENEEITMLREQIYKLERKEQERLDDLKPAKAKPEEASVSGDEQSEEKFTNESREATEGLSTLKFHHAPATKKAPSGGIISGGKVKARREIPDVAPKPKKASKTSKPVTK